MGRYGSPLSLVALLLLLLCVLSSLRTALIDTSCLPIHRQFPALLNFCHHIQYRGIGLQLFAFKTVALCYIIVS